MHISTANVICYDSGPIERFFSSVGYAMASQQCLRTEWESYKEESFGIVSMDRIYTLFPWKVKPGFASSYIDTSLVALRARDLAKHYMQAWIRILHKGGPAAASRYISSMAFLRDNALREISTRLRETSAENIDYAHKAVEKLAEIKLGATVGVAVIGGVATIAILSGVLVVCGVSVGAGASAFAASGLGYSAVKSVVSTWEKGATAQIAAVTLDNMKGLLSEKAGDQMKEAVNTSLHESRHINQVRRSASRQISKYSERIAQHQLAPAALRRNFNKLGAAQRTSEKSMEKLLERSAQRQGMRLVGKAIPVVFSAWDIMDGINEYSEDMK